MSLYNYRGRNIPRPKGYCCINVSSGQGSGQNKARKAQTEGRFLGLKTISNEAREQIDQEIERAAMARMFNLRNMFELVIDGLDKQYPAVTNKQAPATRVRSQDAA